MGNREFRRRFNRLRLDPTTFALNARVDLDRLAQWFSGEKRIPKRVVRAIERYEAEQVAEVNRWIERLRDERLVRETIEPPEWY